MRVLFTAPKDGWSSPAQSAARALANLAPVEVRFSCGAEYTDLRTWWRLVRWAQVIVVLDQSGPQAHLLRQLSIAVAAGTPVVRWWIGTDVLNALRQGQVALGARMLSTILSGQIAVAPHLVEELASIGVSAKFIPSLLDNELVIPTDAGKDVLVYLPNERRDFYGFSAVRSVIKQMENTRFIVVADQEHALASLPNVESLGWVKLEHVWPQVRCLLRLTEHDGMPRMVLDALRRGKYVVYSWPFRGCYLARSVSEVIEAVTEIESKPDLNRDGMRATEELFSMRPASQFAGTLRVASHGPCWKKRLRALSFAIRSHRAHGDMVSNECGLHSSK